MKTPIKLLPFLAVLFLVLTPILKADVIDDLSPAFRLVADDLVGASGAYVGSGTAAWTDQVGGLVMNSTWAVYPAPADPAGQGNRPQLYNGVMNFHNAVRFDETRSTLLQHFSGTTVPPLYNPTGNTYLVVFRRAAADTGDSPLLGIYQENDNFGVNRTFGIGRLYAFGNKGTVGNLMAIDGTGVTVNPAYPVPVKQIIAGVMTDSGAAINIYANGILVGSGGGSAAVPPAGAPRTISIGAFERMSAAATPQFYSSVDIAEVAIFTRVLNSTELAKLNSYVELTYLIAPEPASLVLLGLGLTMFVARRR